MKPFVTLDSLLAFLFTCKGPFCFCAIVNGRVRYAEIEHNPTRITTLRKEYIS